MLNRDTDIFSYITAEETAYQLPIEVVEGYEWNMPEHINTTVLYKNSEMVSGKNKGKEDEKPIKNITRPILNLAYRAEGFDVKDIQLYVDSAKDYYKSFFVKKYHDIYSVENAIDTMIDYLVECYIDFGGVLVKKLDGQPAPEVVRLETIAFCDQSDLLGNPFGIKHQLTADQLQDYEEYGWGDKANGADITIEELLVLSTKYDSGDRKTNDIKKKQIKSTGRHIEVYEIHGVLPESFLKEDGDTDKYVRQLQIVAFYTKEDGMKQGVYLFRGKEEELPFKFLARDEVFGRALGFGGAEEIFEPQVWVNYGMIRKKELLDQAAMQLYKSNDKELEGANMLSEKRAGDVVFTESLDQVDTHPRNMAVFDNAVSEWEVHAMQMGSANEVSLGNQPKSGTPFKLQELVTSEAHSLHEYRKGKLAVFVAEIYRDWIIPEMMKHFTDKEFLADLDVDEMQYVGDAIVKKRIRELTVAKQLSAQPVDEQEMAALEAVIRNEFMQDNKKFLKLLKEDIKDMPVTVKINIAGKQKYMPQMTDKLTNVFRQIAAAPQILDDPYMMKLLNEILEASGLDPINYHRGQQPTQPQQVQQPAQIQQSLTNNQQ